MRVSTKIANWKAVQSRAWIPRAQAPRIQKVPKSSTA